MRFVFFGFLLFFSLNSFGGNSPELNTFVQNLRDQAIQGRSLDAKLIQTKIEEVLKQVQTENVFFDEWPHLFSLICLHAETKFLQNQKVDVPIAELKRLTVKTSKFKTSILPIFLDRLIAQMTNYLNSRGNPEISELWWKMFIESEPLIQNSKYYYQALGNLVDAQTYQGRFDSANQTLNRWLKSAKNSTEQRFQYLIRLSRLARTFNKVDLVIATSSKLSFFKFLTDQNEEARLRIFHSLLYQKKFDDCEKTTQIELQSKIPLPIGLKIGLNSNLIECLLGLKKLVQAEKISDQNIAELKSPGVILGIKRSALTSHIFVKIEKNQLDQAFEFCLLRNSDIPKVQSYFLIHSLALCSTLKPDTKKWPREIEDLYNNQLKQFEHFASRSEHFSIIFEVLKANISGNADKKKATRISYFKKNGSEGILAKALSLK